MAHALGVEREDVLLGAAGRRRAGRLRSLGPAPPRARAGRLYHRPPRLLDDRARGRPRRAGPPPGQRDADRGGGRSFRRRRAGADPRSRHRARHPAARRARPVAGATGLGIDASEDALAYARRNAARSASPGAPNSAAATGARGSTSVSTSSSATRLMSKPASLCRPTWRAGSRPSRSMRARTGSTPIAGSRRGSPACSRRAALPASKSAPARRKAVSRAACRRGFTIESRSDLSGDRALPHSRS